MKVNGKDKVCVTVASEAFGLLVLENCREKWRNIFEFKQQHGVGAAIPVTGDESLPFKAKWTDSKCGRIKFGGWDAEAYTFFEDAKVKVKTVRQNDSANNFETQEFALTLLREKHNITATAPGKKRKRSKKNAVANPTAPRRITHEEE